MSALLLASAHALAPIMFAALILILLLGYPVAFSLGALGLSFYGLGVWLTPYSEGALHLDWALLHTLPERVFAIMTSETLLSIPFFTVMGLVLERSGMAEDLLTTIGTLCGGIRGGLAYAVIFVGILLAATTGVVAASVIAMGLIALPVMLRAGYDRAVSCGVIAASGTLAQIMPPALVLIVLADQMQQSVGAMYRAAFIPALVLSVLFALFIAVLAWLKPALMPALNAPAERGTDDYKALIIVAVLGLWQGAICYGALIYFALVSDPSHALVWAGALTVTGLCLAALTDQRRHTPLLPPLAHRVILVMTPPLALIVIVLGSIIIGLATPSEAGALGCLGALTLAALKGRLDKMMLDEVLERAVRLTSFAVFILIGARVFSLTFFAIGGQSFVEGFLTHLPYGRMGFLIFVNIALFILAFFLEFFELAFIIIPLLVPAAQHLGIDLIWLGVIIGLNVQTSFMHPPFGYSLFYLRSVAPERAYIDASSGQHIAPVTSAHIYLGAVPFVVLQMIMVGLVIAFPALTRLGETRSPIASPSALEKSIDGLPHLPLKPFMP
jgi:TRAP-type mannitol/chloroaromatic compound transport system permease large subunit